jgi:hypothetical protein
VMLSDDELLDFDVGGLDTAGGEYDGRALLAQHGDVFRSHLLLARWLDGWCQRVCEPPFQMDPKQVYYLTNTLLDLVAFLRLGKFLPGGTFYEDEIRREPEDWIRPAPPF